MLTLSSLYVGSCQSHSCLSEASFKKLYQVRQPSIHVHQSTPLWTGCPDSGPEWCNGPRRAGPQNGSLLGLPTLTLPLVFYYPTSESYLRNHTIKMISQFSRHLETTQQAWKDTVPLEGFVAWSTLIFNSQQARYGHFLCHPYNLVLQARFPKMGDYVIPIIHLFSGV